MRRWRITLTHSFDDEADEGWVEADVEHRMDSGEWVPNCEVESAVPIEWEEKSDGVGES